MSEDKSGIVLSGGEIKGSWQIGALSRFAEWTGPEYRPDYISGTSVGAINAYAIGCFMAKGVTFYESVMMVEDWWKTRINSGKDIAKKRSVVSMVRDLLDGKWDGVQSMAPLRRLLEELGQGVDMRQCAVPIEAATVQILSGEVRYWRLNLYDTKTIIDIVMASAMMPIIMPPQTVMNVTGHYDGGLRDIAPLSGAIAHGCEEVTAFVCSPEYLERGKGRSLPNLAGRIISVFTNELVNNDLRLCHEINESLADATGVIRGDHPKYRYINLGIVRPPHPIHLDIWSFIKADILGLIEQGKRDAEVCLYMPVD